MTTYKTGSVVITNPDGTTTTFSSTSAGPTDVDANPTLSGGEDALESITIDDEKYEVGGGEAVWGSITGTLSSQTDLNTALSGKQATLDSTSANPNVIGPLVVNSGELSLELGWGVKRVQASGNLYTLEAKAGTGISVDNSGINIDTTGATAGQVLTFDGSSVAWTSLPAANGVSF